MNTLGVVIVTYNSSDVILDCLESLLAAEGVQLAAVVVDNASTDGTPDLLRHWAGGRAPYSGSDDLPFPLVSYPKPLRLRDPASEAPLAAEGHALTLIETGSNGGFAAGVNRGLAYLANSPEIHRFWILNPDSVVAPGTPKAFATQPVGPDGFSLMGGRLIYLHDDCNTIQSDGGLIKRLTGVTGNSNQYRSLPVTAPPDPSRIDFVTGASMVASRRFLEEAGLLPEDYFLYYEEVDWALRRGKLPLAHCPDAIVYHRAGTAIGSASLGRPASSFSLYFKHRSRMLFLRRHFPWSLPTGFFYSLAKSCQLASKGSWAEARTVLLASLGLPPPANVRIQLSPEAQARAFVLRR